MDNNLLDAVASVAMITDATYHYLISPTREEIDEFVTANKLGYQIVIGTWYEIGNSAIDRLGDYIVSSIRGIGLYATIQRFAEMADNLRTGLVGSLILDDFITSCMQVLPIEQVLCIFNYPKRFTPVLPSQNKLAQESVAEFSSMDLANRRPPCLMHSSDALLGVKFSSIRSKQLLRAIKLEIESIISNIDSQFDSRGIPPATPDAFWLPTGATAELPRAASAWDRCKVVSRHFEQLGFGDWARLYQVNGPIDKSVILTKMPMPTLDIHQQHDVKWVGNELICTNDKLVINTYAKIDTVPKNYKRNRIIGYEQLYRQILAHPINNFIRYKLKQEGNDLSDQTRNQNLAKFGAETGLLDTIDLHAASDSMTSLLLRVVLPPVLVRFLDIVCSENHVINGRIRKSGIPLPMGHILTFPIMSLILLAACRVTNRYVAMIKKVDVSNYNKVTSVYGDDIIVHHDTSATLIEVLELLGFSVNREKSFTEGNFRESCGVEYFLSTDVSSTYYPRKAIKSVSDLQSLASLCALQQRLYPSESASFLADFLASKCKTIYYVPPYAESVLGLYCDNYELVGRPYFSKYATKEELYAPDGVYGMRLIGGATDYARKVYKNCDEIHRDCDKIAYLYHLSAEVNNKVPYGQEIRNTSFVTELDVACKDHAIYFGARSLRKRLFPMF